MFEQSILRKSHGGRRFFSTCLGVAGEALVVAFVVIAPMVWPQVLPRPQNWITLYTPSVPPPPARNLAKPAATHVDPTRAASLRQPFTAPSRIPPQVAMLTDPPLEMASASVAGGLETGSGPGVPGSLLPSILDTARTFPMAPPPEVRAAPAPPKEPAMAPRRIRIGHLEPGKLLVAVKPLYPPLAKAARVSGTVELDAVIGTDGRLKEIKAKSGNPLLVPAAVEAVRQWVYQPTILNGDAVEVITSILVTFTLNQ
jgi:periplasmic protein TonB